MLRKDIDQPVSQRAEGSALRRPGDGLLHLVGQRLQRSLQDLAVQGVLAFEIFVEPRLLDVRCRSDVTQSGGFIALLREQ